MWIISIVYLLGAIPIIIDWVRCLCSKEHNSLARKSSIVVGRIATFFLLVFVSTEYSGVGVIVATFLMCLCGYFEMKYSTNTEKEKDN